MPKPVVRRAKKEDIDTIVGFNISMAQETESISLDPLIIQSGVEGLFNTPEYGFYVVCEVEGSVTASLMITYEWSDWRNGIFWWIQSVFVKKEFRQQGLYKLMYDFIKTQVQKEDTLVGIRLYVDENNVKAKTVYSKLGMTHSNYELFEYLKEKRH